MNTDIIINRIVKEIPPVNEILDTINTIGIDETLNQLNQKILEKNSKYLKLFSKLPQKKQLEIIDLLDKNLNLEVILSGMHKYKPDYYNTFMENNNFREFVIKLINYWRDFFELSPL